MALTENMKNFLSGCFDNSTDLFILLSSDFLVLDINPTASKILGWKIKKIYNKKIDEIFEKTSTQPLATLKRPVARSTEFTYIKNNGKKLKIMWNIIPLQSTVSKKKKPELVAIVGKNVTKKTGIQFDSMQLDNIIQYAPGFFYWKDENSVYQGCNEEFAKFAGLKSSKEVKGKTDYDLSWKARADLYVKVDKNVIKSGKPRLNHEELISVAGNKTITAITNKVPLLDRHNKVIGVLGITTDITQQKEIEHNLEVAKEQAEAANKAKSEFISNMSHDVKTPLSGIISIAELLQPYIEEQYVNLAQEIMVAGLQLMRFFENCIELFKLESGSIISLEENFSLEQLLDEIFKLFAPAVRAKGLELHVECAKEIPTSLQGNRIKLYRILLNLVGNAIKFTQQGSITISALLSEKSTADNAVIKLTITDTGIGIPKDQQNTIFERFSRIVPSYQGTYEGSGIGLHIVQKFVKDMGGEIYVKSHKDVGSQFTVIVPMQIAPLAEHQHNDKLKLLPSRSKRKEMKPPKLNSPDDMIEASQHKNITQISPRILLVEDNSLSQKGASMLLQSLGCKIDIADCGKKAISMFQPGKYDLILLDIGLPDMKGYEVSAFLRKMEQGTDHCVPILGLSAHANEEAKQFGIDAGMEKIYSKPLLLDQAKALLEQYVFSRSQHV